MKVPHWIPNSEILNVLNSSYDFHANKLTFIPIGDMSYGYKVECSNGITYFLKILDKKNQQDGIVRADSYLPLLYVLKRHNLFPNAIYPILNKEKKYQTETVNVVLILFPWMEGTTLADDYPFSESIVQEIAKQVAKLHLATPLISKEVQLPAENYDLGFELDLLSCLKLLANLEHEDDMNKSELATLVLPREEDIRTLLTLLKGLQLEFKRSKDKFVLCHGDLWGGNIMQSSTGLHFIDWESAVLAPREREMVGFVTQRLTEFVDTYNKEIGRLITPNLNLLTFYSFQRQLSNLTHWMLNILFRNTEETQQKNDLQMIEFHCLDRWDWIEGELKKLKIYYGG